MNDKQKFQAILDILKKVPEYKPNHHLGRPFLSVYQLAIKFSEKYPNDIGNLQIGGVGVQESNSLAQHLALFLSKYIKKNQKKVEIEGGFISHENLTTITFFKNITPSTISTKNGHSIFRYIGK